MLPDHGIPTLHELHPRRNEICVPFQVFMSTFPILALAARCPVSQPPVFVRSCPRVFPLSMCFVRLSSSSGIRIAPRLCSRPMLSAPYLLPLIKARLRVESCFNCAARSSDFFNCEFTSALTNLLHPSTSAPCDCWLTRLAIHKCCLLALSLELVRTRSFQLFLKFCQGVFKLLALLVKISEVSSNIGSTLVQLVCS